VEHLDELIAAHALDALDADAAEAAEQHLAECPQCRKQLAEYRSVAAGLALSAPQAAPPPDLRGRILASVEPVVTAPAAVPEPRRRRRLTWPSIAVPALGLAVVALLIWNVSLRSDINSLHSSLSSDRTATMAGFGNVVAQPGGTVRIFASPSAPPSGKTYEAWVITPAGNALPAGTFTTASAGFTLTQPGHRGDVIAVTVEPSGGSPKPTTKPIAAAHI
jgi:anti-sigma-K factor RskA